MRRSVCALGVVALLAPLSAAAVPLKAHNGWRELVYVTTRDGITAVDAGTGEEAFAAQGAVPSGNWGRLIVAVPEFGGVTSMRALNPVTGAVVESTTLDGDLAVRSVSYYGTQVVLVPRDQHTSSYKPQARSRTRLVVAGFDGAAPRVFDLHGNFEPEALSTGGDSLFVLEYTPPEHPTKYRIRRLELKTGELYKVYALDKDVQGNMRGQARTQVLAPDGTQLYTLYTKPNGEAFVHVLSLTGEWAHCADLPAPFGKSPRAMAIATSSDGRRLYVVDTSSGSIAEIGTSPEEISRGALRVVPGDGSFGPARDPIATVEGERLFLASGRNVTTIRIPTLHVIQSTALAFRVVGIGAAGSPLLPRLYVADLHWVADVSDSLPRAVFESGARILGIRRVITTKVAASS